MIPVAFDYQRAVTVDEAIAALSSGDGKILAGGHSLLPAMKLRLNQPAKLVDISKIDALKGIKEEDGEIVIGAGTTHGTIASDDLIKSKLPFFATAAALIGDVQVRNHGTIGGSLAHADPAADWGALVLAADAAIITKGSSGSRRVAAVDFSRACLLLRWKMARSSQKSAYLFLLKAPKRATRNFHSPPQDLRLLVVL